MKLYEIITQVKNSCKAAGITPTDDVILRMATNIYVVNNDKPDFNEVKLLNTDEIEQPRTLPKPDNKPKPFNKPTKNQLWRLDKEGIKYDETLTFEEASKIIQELKR